MGAWGAAKRPRGGVLVIHENRGLNDSIRSIAGRLAASGYSALAIDLLSEEGGTGSFADEFEAMAALGAVPPSRFVADMKAGVTEIRRRLPKKKVAATGFCFGGGMTWLLLASKERAAGRRGAVLRAVSRTAGASRERRRRCSESMRSSTRGSTPRELPRMRRYARQA